MTDFAKYALSECRVSSLALDRYAATAINMEVMCYQYMFNGCTKLNYIKALFLTKPSSSYTPNWVEGVAEEGTFVKNPKATWDVRGVNGIPEGWSVE